MTRGEEELSDAVLVGETRCKSYLRGRGLSELEAGVLILSAKKMGRAAIAESLAISVATVSAYRARGARKLGAGASTRRFASCARRAGWTRPEGPGPAEPSLTGRGRPAARPPS